MRLNIADTDWLWGAVSAQQRKWVTTRTCIEGRRSSKRRGLKIYEQEMDITKCLLVFIALKGTQFLNFIYLFTQHCNKFCLA